MAVSMAAWAQPPQVTGLGVLPGYAFSVPGTGVCLGNSGTAFTGTAISNFGLQMAMQNKPTGLVALGYLPGTNSSIAAATSDDGRVVVGFCLGGGPAKAFRSVNGVMTDLGLPPVAGASFPRPAGVSSNGQVIVGSVATGAGNLLTRGWRLQGSIYSLIGLLPGGSSNYVRAVSGDGLVTVGEADAAGGNWFAFAWRASTGTVALPSPNGAPCTAASANFDGSVIVGSSGSVGAIRAVAWVNGSLVMLPPLLATDAESKAVSVSGDGQLIGGDSGGRACIWSLADRRVMAVEDLLASHGADLSAWNLSSVTAISPDGQFVAGPGEHVLADGSRRTEGWIVQQPSICQTDWNSDGGIDGSDSADFMDAWSAGQADLNLDGGTDGADIVEFFDRWSNGAC